MSFNKTVGVLAGAASATFAGVTMAGVTPSDSDARIAALEQQIADLKADSSNWMSQNDEQLRALVQEVLSDSETRASLQREGAYGGYDNGFFLSNGDGSFRLNIGLLEQIRWVWNSRDGEIAPGFDTDVNGFENRRTRLNFYGNAFGRDTTYQIQGDFSRDGGAFVLLDGWVGHTYDNGWNFRAGQFKAPFLRETLVSARHQLAADRSYVEALTTGGRTQGIEGRYESDSWRFNIMYSDGWAAGTGFNGSFMNTGFSTATTEWAFTGRAETLLAGTDWDQFEDFTSSDDDDFGLLLGGAAHIQKGEFGTATGPDEAEVFAWTVDLQAEFGGSNLAGYFVGQHIEPNADALPSADQYGFVVQGGIMVTENFEPFARYEWFDFDTTADDANIVTIGFNYYIHGHNLKWTTDVVWALDSVPAAAPGLGLLADATGEEDQIAVRSQLQLALP